MPLLQGYVLSDNNKHNVGDKWSKEDKEIILYRNAGKAISSAWWISKIWQDNKKIYTDVYLVEGLSDIFKEMDEFLFTNFPTKLKIVKHVRSFTEDEALLEVSGKQVIYDLNKMVNFFRKGSR